MHHNFVSPSNLQFRSSEGSGHFIYLFGHVLHSMVAPWNDKARKALSNVLAVIPQTKYQYLHKAVPQIGIFSRSQVAKRLLFLVVGTGSRQYWPAFHFCIYIGYSLTFSDAQTSQRSATVIVNHKLKCSMFSKVFYVWFKGEQHGCR